MISTYESLIIHICIVNHPYFVTLKHHHLDKVRADDLGEAFGCALASHFGPLK